MPCKIVSSGICRQRRPRSANTSVSSDQDHYSELPPSGEKSETFQILSVSVGRGGGGGGGGVGCGEGVVYLASPGRPTDIGLQLGKACYLYSR